MGAVFVLPPVLLLQHVQQKVTSRIKVPIWASPYESRVYPACFFVFRNPIDAQDIMKLDFSDL